MLSKEKYLHETRTIQVSTCKKFLSTCFNTREILVQHTTINSYKYYLRTSINIYLRISINIYHNYRQNILYWNQHSNKFFPTGTKLYQCIKLTQHIPRHIYHFDRYFVLLLLLLLTVSFCWHNTAF